MGQQNENARRYYECVDCRERTVTDEHLGNCPNCGGEVTNIAVPRER